MEKTKNGKILFVVQDYYQYQTYVQTVALREVRDRIYFLVPPVLAELDYGIPRERVIPFDYPWEKEVPHRHVFNIHSWKLRHTNKGFWIRTLFFTRRQKIVYRILALPGLYHLARFYFLQKARDNQLDELVRRIDPAIAVLPSHMFEGLTYELIRITREMKVPSFMVINNWDTVAYRSSFTFLPDYLGVWSRQQVEHASLVKNMPRDRICILGTPKFIKYFVPEKLQQPPIYPFRYILWIGAYDEFNELEALHLLDNAIEKHNVPLTVVYRPTAQQFPRKCPDVFFEYDFKHVILDINARIYYKKSTSWDFSKDKFDPKQFPDPMYNLRLLQNAEFVIGPQSTMTLEAVSLGKVAYVIAYDDGLHKLGPKWTLENTAHLEGLECVENIRLIRSKEDLERVFLPGDRLKETFKKLMTVDWFVSRESTVNYPKNFKNTVDAIINKWNTSI